MTDKFKKRVRERMDREGVSYSEALRREQGTPAARAADAPDAREAAEPRGIEADGPAPEQAPAASLAAAPVCITVSPELLDRHDWRRGEIARVARSIGGDGGPTVIDIGILPDGLGAYLRVYIEASGPPATAEWLSALEGAVRAIEALDPIGPFEDYSPNDPNDYD